MNRPDKYIYPAILTYEEGYDIGVTFPDLPGCATCGENELEAVKMAKEALGGHLWCMEVDNDEIPQASKIKDIKLEENEVAILVEVYMPSIRLAHENRSVNRTITLPAWMNAKAVELGVNFSQALQDTLVNQYHIVR
ncbi:MAG: type II toxin-antitoxin system HicB family antitoxin [Clostridiales bacterium]|nr:type II toxin-antitoxin system HicB family antitoxin [Clostridiales bacterium]